MRKAGLVGVLVLLAAGVGVFARGFGHDPHAVPSVLRGRPAPDFHLQALDGTAVAASSLRGRPAVVNFWSTWCLPCQLEHPLLQAAARRYQGRVTFLGVVYQDEADRVRDDLARRGSHFPQLLDPGSRTAIDFGVAGVPETFVLDGRGIIVHKEAGVVAEATLVALLDRLLADALPAGGAEAP